MRVLIVCSYRTYISDGIAPFIKEQVNAVAAQGITCDYYLVHGKGIAGYMLEIPRLRKKIRAFHPNIIHAHYGLSCLLANLASRRIPVISTYHGSDINNPTIRRFSKLAMRLSVRNIFVSSKNMETAGAQKSPKALLIPCGIDGVLFTPQDKKTCRMALGLQSDKCYVLFAKMFGDPVKDYPLAKNVIDLVNASTANPHVTLLEFTGYTREQAALLMNAVDAILMTSKNEGSPQVIKEAMACGCPIVSVDVGDVKERVQKVQGCYVAKTREPEELAELLNKALAFSGKTNGREELEKQNLSNDLTAKKIIALYQSIRETK